MVTDKPQTVPEISSTLQLISYSTQIIIIIIIVIIIIFDTLGLKDPEGFVIIIIILLVYCIL